MRQLVRIITLMALVHGSSSFVRAQTHDRIVQVSGVVVTSDSLEPVAFATIYRSHDYRGTFSDYKGYFTLPVAIGDTLHFDCLGQKHSAFVIPYDTVNQHLSIVQIMDADTVMLPTVYILPHPAKHKLREEVLALDLPGDNYYKFTRQQGEIANYDGLHDFADISYQNASNTMEARYNTKFLSGGNLLDPAAWGRFMQSIKSGEYRER
jgi:CarboxypepD_reg-like domain